MPKQFIVILFVSISAVAFAQKPAYTSSNTKAIRTYENAMKFAQARQDGKAISEAKSAIEMDSTFVEPLLLLANIYADANNTDKAKEYYRKAVTINPDFFPRALFSLGKIEFAAGEYDEAKKHLEKFITYNKMAGKFIYEAKILIENCVFASYAIKHPVPFVPVNLGDSINSPYDEYFPAITGDGGTFLFTRLVPASLDYNLPGKQEDFYVSYLNKDGWSKAVPVKEINTSGNEGAPSLSADGQYLFFTSCAEGHEDVGRRKNYGSCDIYIAKKVGNKWMNPRNLGETINSAGWESQPSFSSDGRTLYFIHADVNPNGTTDRNIYTSHVNDDATWSTPEKLSDKINTPGDEQSVFIHPDNQTLYFSSNGHPGMGGMDIFVSRRQPNGEWGDPVNLGYPINTPGDERSLLVAPSGDVAYFSSDRPGGKGGLDIYSFALYDSIKPKKLVYLKGHVIDAETKTPIASNFQLIDLATGKTVVNSTSNGGNGEFLVVLPAGMNYALNVSHENYLFYSEHFELKDPKSADKPEVKDILMKPIKVGESVVLKNIFYQTDAYNLKDESKIELNKLISFMKANPKVKIEISGHTDNVGAQQYNQVLSEKRAKSVYDYLITNGIIANRISYKGYGDTKPIADNSTEAGRSQNRRTEFTVVAIN